MTEAALQRAIVTYLQAVSRGRFLFFSIPNERKGYTVQDWRNIARLKRQGLTAGVPDLCVVLRDGQCFFLEVKTPRGRLSEAQKKWHSQAQALGIHVVVVRSLDDVEKILFYYDLLI